MRPGQPDPRTRSRGPRKLNFLAWRIRRRVRDASRRPRKFSWRFLRGWTKGRGWCIDRRGLGQTFNWSFSGRWMTGKLFVGRLTRYCRGNIVIPLERGQLMRSWSPFPFEPAHWHCYALVFGTDGYACFQRFALGQMRLVWLINSTDCGPIDKDTLIMGSLSNAGGIREFREERSMKD